MASFTPTYEPQLVQKCLISVWFLHNPGMKQQKHPPKKHHKKDLILQESFVILVSFIVWQQGQFI